MSYRSGLQMFAIMTNWKTEFHKPLTRPGVKHDEEMSICSSIPQAHRGYINSSLLESDLKMSESHANALMRMCRLCRTYRIYPCIMRTFFPKFRVRNLHCALYSEPFVWIATPLHSFACMQERTINLVLIGCCQDCCYNKNITNQ